ncbi:MAG: peptidoglycan binding protein CsiV, partial [Gammaproteobacteria bacterium]|nr:peptidoglycan binding protein CsiV [Gammaproteobacteria bacterium]
MKRASLINNRSNLCAAAAGACGLLLTICSHAQQQAVPNAAMLEAEKEPARRYSVELIVFEYAGDAANTMETFNPDLPTEPLVDLLPDNGVAVDPAAWPDPADGGEGPVFDDLAGLAVTVPDSGEGGAEPFVLLPGEELGEIRTFERMGVQIIPPEEYQLRAAYDKLIELDAYRPLMHAAWIQPAVEEAETEALKLRRIGDPPLRLDGTVALYLGRYLHLVIDLALEHKSPLRMQADRERIRAYAD